MGVKVREYLATLVPAKLCQQAIDAAGTEEAIEIKEVQLNIVNWLTETLHLATGYTHHHHFIRLDEYLCPSNLTPADCALDEFNTWIELADERLFVHCGFRGAEEIIQGFAKNLCRVITSNKCIHFKEGFILWGDNVGLLVRTSHAKDDN